MTSNYTIRRAVPADADLISVLAATTFYEAYFEQDAPSTIAAYAASAFSPAAVAAQLDDADSEFHLISRGRGVVGWAKLRRGTSAEGVDPATDIELERIYIVERDWGKGAGQALLEFCIARAGELGFPTIWLGVWTENPRAIRFYEKNGFVVVGQRTFPYGGEVGMNHVMALRISDFGART